MRPQKVYVTRDNVASIQCSRCTKQKTIVVSRIKDPHKTIMVKCTCGFNFPIVLEKRKHYRKDVNFLGHYSTEDTPLDRKPITIEDISRAGIKFHTHTRNELTPGKRIAIYFVLDDAQRTPMKIEVTILRVQGSEVGGELSSVDIPKALAFYLLP